MEDTGFAVITWVSFGFSYVNGEASWRTIFGIQAIFAIILFVGTLILPRSPRFVQAFKAFNLTSIFRWLALKGRDEDCLRTLAKLHGK